MRRPATRAAPDSTFCAWARSITLYNSGQKQQVKLKEDWVASVNRTSLPVSRSKLALLRTAELAELAGPLPRASECGISTIWPPISLSGLAVQNLAECAGPLCRASKRGISTIARQ